MFTKLVRINNLKIKGQCSTCFYRDDSGMCSQKGFNTYRRIIRDCWCYRSGISMLGNYRSDKETYNE